jgi:Arc/MetJ-type ribon-helix-helix transcriptional regulator
VAKASKANKLIAVRLPDEYVTGLERIATRNYESVSDVLRRAVRELIAREEKIGK